MIRIENVEVYGWEAAIRGMRNPMNSWDKSDTAYNIYGQVDLFENFIDGVPEIGENDLDLMHKLSKAGSDHGKYLRMISVVADITAPLYWWKEYDTYKVGTVANSCSTMHKIQSRKFTLSDFSTEHLLPPAIDVLTGVIDVLNEYRKSFNKTKEKSDWWQMIQLLPSSYNQKRTVSLNYAVLKNMYGSRRNHKLDEWIDMCKWIETLPYTEVIR